jgi:hypothetical protein
MRRENRMTFRESGLKYKERGRCMNEKEEANDVQGIRTEIQRQRKVHELEGRIE